MIIIVNFIIINNNRRIATLVIIHIITPHEGNPYYHIGGNPHYLRNLNCQQCCPIKQDNIVGPDNLIKYY